MCVCIVITAVFLNKHSLMFIFLFVARCQFIMMVMDYITAVQCDTKAAASLWLLHFIMLIAVTTVCVCVCVCV